MLSDLLGKLQEILKNYNIKLNNEQIRKLEELLSFYKGGIIPTAVVKRTLNISYAETHNLMIFLMTKNILKSKYKIHCENDLVTGAGKIYDDPAEIPIELCDRCERGCALIKNLVVEFEVVI